VDHVAPDYQATRGQEALEDAAVGATQRPLPCDARLALDENLDLDRHIGKTHAAAA
jgi:hypothetical protein